ncbi:MAG: glycosyltransferase [Lacisediminihabitans sp.]
MAARILIIDHTAELGGAEVALSRLLEAIDRKRFEVSVLLLAPGPLVDRLRVQHIRVAVLTSSQRLTAVGRLEAAASPFALLRNAIGALFLVPKVAAAIRSSRADIVVANSLKSAVLTAIAAPLAGRGWIWHLHDRIAPDYLPRSLVFGLRSLARWSPRMIVTNSQATRLTIPRVPDARIAVAYPGVDVTDTARSLAPRPPATPHFGLLGRIAPTKGQREFLQAAALVMPDRPDIRFSIIGDALFNDGPFANEIRALPAALGIDTRVTFTGWLDDPMTEVRTLTALVHASPVAEPFGQVIVEAMLAGVPVIGTDAGGVREILDADGHSESISAGVRRTQCGVLVEPGNPVALAAAIVWMADHVLERNAMAEHARERAIVRFDIRKSASKTERAWTCALGPKAVDH